VAAAASESHRRTISVTVFIVATASYTTAWNPAPAAGRSGRWCRRPR
jgi:hypothetical protein